MVSGQIQQVGFGGIRDRAWGKGKVTVANIDLVLMNESHPIHLIETN